MLGSAISFLLPLFFFGVTVFPTLPTGDSGGLVTAACTLGVPHPAGFPLYRLIGRLFCFLPVGNPALSLNLMSGFFGALTCLSLFLCLRELQLSWVVTWIAPLLLATSGIFWSVSIVAEVYTLQTFLLGLIFWLSLRYRRSGRSLERNLIFLLVGLSAANHWPLLILASPSLLILLIGPLRKERWEGLFKGAAFLLLGLLPYLYLPFSSSYSSPLDWNHTRRFGNLILHLFRLNTSESKPGWEWKDWIRLFDFFGRKVILKDFSWVGFPLAFLGLQACWKRDKVLVLSLIVGWILSFLVILLWVRIPLVGSLIHSVYVTLSQASFFVAFAVALGIDRLAHWSTKP